MPSLRPYIDQVDFNGFQTQKATADDFGAATGKAISQAGSDVDQAADNINQVEEIQSRLRAANLVTQADSSWRQQMIQMQSDPDFAQKYGEDGSGFSTAFKSKFEEYAQQQIGGAAPHDRKYVEQGMYNLGQGLMNNAMEFEANTGAQFATQTIQNSIDAGRNNAMMSPDQTQSIMENTNLVISQAPHLNEAQRLKLQTDMQQQVALGSVMGQLQKTGIGAAQTILNGGMTVPVVGQDGKTTSKNIADVLDGNMFTSLQSAADTVIKQQGAAVKQASTDLKDDFSTKIKLSETSDAFLTLADQVEKSQGSLGKKNYDDLRVELHEKMKKIGDDVDSQQRGNAFATGESYLNPNDNGSMKDYNNYYKHVVQPTLSSLSPEERNTRLASLVNTTKVVPDDLAGDIKIAARSNDVNTVTNMADFVDRVRAQNPAVLSAFDSKDLARIDMVNQKVASGLTPGEAFKQTDELLDPNNKSTVDAREKYLAKKATGIGATNYEGMAMDNFQSNWFVRALPGSMGEVDKDSTTFAKNTVSQLTTEYKAAYDNQFKLTGDTTASQKYANQVVSGMYGVSDINGSNQLMRYAPEKYFAIDGQNNDWMKQQLQDAVKENLGPDKILQAQDSDLSRRIILTPDPSVTSRTAKTGTPLYKLFYQNGNGGLDDVLGSGKYFTFDPMKARQDLLTKSESDEALRQKGLKEGNPGGAGVGIIAP